MRNLLPQVFRSSVAGVVAGLIAVGSLVVVSSAGGLPFVGGSEDSVPSVELPADSTVPDSAPEDGTDLQSQLQELRDTVDSLVESVDGLTEDSAAHEETIAAHARLLAGLAADVDSLSGTLGALSSAVKELRSTVSGLGTAVEALKTDVSGLKQKTSKLGETGDYSGPVDPAQLTRKLTPTDISGNWPLGRTTDKLDSDKLATPTFGCFADSRYNVFLTVDAFGRIACSKILK